jgi:hypothetical protein
MVVNTPVRRVRRKVLAFGYVGWLFSTCFFRSSFPLQSGSRALYAWFLFRDCSVSTLSTELSIVLY